MQLHDYQFWETPQLLGGIEYVEALYLIFYIEVFIRHPV